MTTDTQVSASVDSAQATPANEPSNPVNEAKETAAPTGEGEQPEGKPEPTEAEKLEAKFQQRIARQTAANREQQRQLQEAKARIAEYEAKLAAQKPLDDKPSPDNFEDHDAYTDALADWKLAQKEKAAAEKAKEPNIDELVEQKVKLKVLESSFKAKENQFREATPDYEKSVSVVNGLLDRVDKNHPSTQAFATALFNAPNPPALIHHLGTNPAVAIQLMGMTPFEIQDTLSEIIDSLSDAPKQQSPKAEPLPAPPTALTGATRVNKTPDQMTGRELLNKYMPKGR